MLETDRLALTREGGIRELRRVAHDQQHLASAHLDGKGLDGAEEDPAASWAKPVVQLQAHRADPVDPCGRIGEDLDLTALDVDLQEVDPIESILIEEVGHGEGVDVLGLCGACSTGDLVVDAINPVGVGPPPGSTRSIDVVSPQSAALRHSTFARPWVLRSSSSKFVSLGSIATILDAGYVEANHAVDRPV